RAKDFQPSGDQDKFVTHTDINWKVLRDNLSIKSDIFRHALRVSIAAIAGYIISQLFMLGHSYWILLTIIVILKSDYSITQKRNYQADAITSRLDYYKNVSPTFRGGNVSDTQFRLSRKEAFVALANLSDAFSRLLSEPKSKQKDPRQIHQFVVLTHTLTSHIAT